MQRIEHGVEVGRGKGWYIAGRWKKPLVEIPALKVGFLASEFANCPSDPQSVLAFTKRFGPLNEQAEPGAEFRFPLFDWTGSQHHFRSLWELILRHPAKGIELQANLTHRLAFAKGKLTYQTKQLLMLLKLDLLSCQHERICKCLRPDCPTPYFVAVHLNQQYCNEVCARWAQQKWKREWWAKNRGKGAKQGRGKGKKRKQR